MYDVIGDIHGHSDALRRLLATLGYEMRDGCFRHADRKVIFVGDFIDRGPAIKDVLEIARTMVERGTALAVMGPTLTRIPVAEVFASAVTFQCATSRLSSVLSGSSPTTR